jgi:hypothetical protein
MRTTGPPSRAIRHAVLLAVAVASAACTVGPSAPPAVPAPSSSPPVETMRLVSGQARVIVTGSMEASFVAPLAPSSLYPASPAQFVLSWGDPRSGQGLDFQGPPVAGSAQTSGDEILAISVRSGDRVVQVASMDGECTVQLAVARPGDVEGSFTCRNVPTIGGAFPGIDATGTFTATATAAG